MGRIARIIFFSVVVLFIVYSIMYLIWGDNNSTSGAGIGLSLSVVMMVVAALAVLVASVFNIIHHPKAGVRVLIGIAVFVLIALIGYSLSSGELMENYYKYGVETAKQSKTIDAELYLMYGLGIIAFLAIIASEVSAAFKK